MGGIILDINKYAAEKLKQLINSGANITIVSHYLGHAQISMTLNTYSHMFKSILEEVVEL
jgi:site-specific recombinase XerD